MVRSLVQTKEAVFKTVYPMPSYWHMHLVRRADFVSASADMELDDLVTNARPAAAVSGGGSGGDHEMRAAAAALVAQLTASGDPKAILEAMAALPQVQSAPQYNHHIAYDLR